MKNYNPIGNSINGIISLPDVVIEGSLTVNGDIIGNVNETIENIISNTATIANALITNATILNILNSSLTSNNILSDNITNSNLFNTNISSSNARITNSLHTNISSSTARITSLFGTVSSITNSNNTNVTSTNIRSTNITSNNLIVSSQNAIFSVSSSQGNIILGTNGNVGILTQNPQHRLDIGIGGGLNTTFLTTGNALITNLTCGSNISLNLTSGFALITNLTSSNIRSTNSTIVNMVADNAQITSLSALSNSDFSGDIYFNQNTPSIFGNGTSGPLTIDPNFSSQNYVRINDRLNVNGTLDVTGTLTAPSGANTIGNLFTNNTFVGIGTTSPGNLLSLRGPTTSVDGPHTRITTTEDDFPLFQQLNFAHNNISLNFDSYYNGLTRASSTTGAFSILKNNVGLGFYYANGSAGSVINLNLGLVLNTSGNVGIGTISPNAKLHINDTTAGIIGLALDGQAENFGTLPLIRFGPSDIAGATQGYSQISTSLVGLGALGQGGLMNLFTKIANTLNYAGLSINQGNVGIGTTSPATRLEVFGPEPAATLGTLLLSSSYNYGFPGGQDTGVSIVGRGQFAANSTMPLVAFGKIGLYKESTANYTDSYMSFFTNRDQDRINGSSSLLSEKMRITSQGFVGIGTTSPTQQLSLTGGLGLANTQSIWGKNSAGVDEQCLWPRWSDNITYLNYGSGGFNIRNNNATTMMFMTTAGNVNFTRNINQTSNYIFNSIVTGNTFAYVNTNFGVFGDKIYYTFNAYNDPATNNWVVPNGGYKSHAMALGFGGVEFYHATANGLAPTTGSLYINETGIYPASNNNRALGATSLRWSNIVGTSINVNGNSNTIGSIITTGGNVGINISNPTAPLNVNGKVVIGRNTTTNDTFLEIDRTSSTGGTVFIQAVTTHNLNYGNLCLNPNYGAFTGFVGIGTTSPAYQLTVASDSAAKPSTNTWTVSSDARLKTNITQANLDTCYNNVKNIPLKRYTWLDSVYTVEQVPDRSKLGWIAQDVETILPKSVEIKNQHGIEDCRSLNADQIIASLYGAVQKLIEKVEQLENSN
jgi:hypothetical protein